MTDVTDGPSQGTSIRRRSIADGENIPNAAIFVKRTAIEFLQAIFSIRADGHLHYDQDDTKTNIQICDQHTVNLDGVNVKPGIVAVRGPLSWQGNMGLGGNSVEGRNMQTGKTTFNDMLTGSVAFSCLSREGIEAEQIAHLVFNSFKFLRPVLQKYGFFSIKSLNIGGESLVEQEGSDDGLYVVPVYVAVQVQDRWTLDEAVGKKLRAVVIATLT